MATVDRHEAGENVHESNSGNQTNSRCLDKNSALIYLSHFLSSFGDRIWGFAVAIYLYYLYPCSLLLTAVYGLSTCGSLFLLGAPLGRWVDKSKRLRAARITIVVQNASVVIGAIMMASAIYYKEDIKSLWNGQLEFIVYASIIIIAVIAELASMANKIVLEKDWIVVLARGNERKLSKLNATMRTINLSCKILAPFVVGHILTWFSYVAGAIFIASWNVVSAIAEYYLLHVIFALVPELANKRKHKDPSVDTIPLVKISSPTNSNDPSTDAAVHEKSNQEISNKDTSEPETMRTPSSQNENQSPLASEKLEKSNNNIMFPSPGDGFEDISLVTPKSLKGFISENHKGISSQSHPDSDHKHPKEKDPQFCKSCIGWKQYFSHPVKFAGVGLASLYMTVLSFDSVTIGYLSSQGVSAGLVGNLTAVAALIGILGSLSFPFFRKKLGKNKAGMFGFGMETLCLLLCVASIIAPGSPFSIDSIVRPFDTTCRNRNPTGQQSFSLKELWEKHSNIYLLMAGIVTARYGLWIADLSVTQIFQEKVEESQRGVMGGVQGSLNQLMSLLKFGLTIALPYPETFGYLICVSWLFVFFGWVFFMVFVYQDVKKTNHTVRPG